jgi:AcrR family transcriptional regulator
LSNAPFSIYNKRCTIRAAKGTAIPIEIDSDARRIAVIAAASDLIAAGGLAAVTFRRLAAHLSCSTTVISHYFRDKEELLRETYRSAIAEAAMLRDRVAAEQSATLVAALEEMLPLAAPQRRIWTIWLCFWTAAIFDSDLLDEHRAGLAGTRERVQHHLIDQGLDSARADRGAEEVTKALFGIAVQALFDRRYWTETRQRAAYRRAIADLP